MPRELRPRKSRPSYSALASAENLSDPDETGAGPSKDTTGVVVEASIENENSSGSDFAPNKDDEMAVESDPVDEDEKEMQLIEDVPGLVLPDQPTTVKKGKARAAPKTVLAKPSTGPSHGPSRRQMYVLPTPSVHHRHRAVPLFSRVGRVERLVERPALFKPALTTPTNNFTHNANVTDRLNKAWGYNTGSGPLWELLEDRGWYKEACEEGSESVSEAKRRPRVYNDVGVQNGWAVLNKEDAARYLPTDTMTTEEGNLKPPPPLPCYFGPFKSQTRIEMQMFDSFPMSRYIHESKSHVFNAGAPVWGLDWCPIHPDDRQARSWKQYLAVAPFPSHSHSPEIGVKVSRPSYACVQIWSLAATDTSDAGAMKCELVLCLEGGPAHELKWCPLPSQDMVSSPKQLKKLGILAGSFEDGSLSIYAIPDPSSIAPPDHDLSQPIYVKLPTPLVRIELEETSCWVIDWANSELLAVGTTNGVIAVYTVGPAIKAASYNSTTITNILPTHYITVHQSAIRAMAWIKVPSCLSNGNPCLSSDPTVIASGGYDGVECMTDIREGHGSIINRTRDVINAMAFSAFAGGPITIDHENTVKSYSASPSMLGRGHTLMEPQGPVWSVDTSDYHPQLAVASADGSCSTTNLLKSTRRGGLVPFFVHKIFQMDYSRKTGEYRMLEQFLPQETQDRPTATRAAKAKTKTAGKANPIGTGAWPREVGVHRVAWNSGNGLSAAGLLASATAAGLCRVDFLLGRWIKGKIPYGDIEHIRNELDENAMVIDSEESVSE